MTTQAKKIAPIEIKAVAARLRALIAEQGMTERGASLKTTGKADTIRNITRAADEGKVYNPRADTIELLARGLGTTPDFILHGNAASSAGGDARLRSGYRPPPRFMGDGSFKLPVFSSAEGGSGALILSTGPIEFQTPPAFLEGVEEGYAILFMGESMIPAVRPGQIGWIDPRMPPMSGEEHVFYSTREDLGEERAVVKDLVSHTKTKWRVHQWNPESTFDLDRKEWQRCHRIMAKFNRR